MPFLAMVEPEWTLNNRSRERREAERLVDRTHAQLRRNQSLGAESHRLSGDIEALFTLCEQEENKLIRRTRKRILDHAFVISADSNTLYSTESVALAHDLEYFDAVMLSAVLSDLRMRGSEPSCFLNRNSSDFATPSIRQELAQLSCKFLASFEQGYAYVRSVLSRLPPAP